MYKSGPDVDPGGPSCPEPDTARSKPESVKTFITVNIADNNGLLLQEIRVRTNSPALTAAEIMDAVKARFI